MVNMVSLYFLIILMFRFLSFFERERAKICLSLKFSLSLGSCVRVFDYRSLSLPAHDSHILRVHPYGEITMARFKWAKLPLQGFINCKRTWLVSNFGVRILFCNFFSISGLWPSIAYSQPRSSKCGTLTQVRRPQKHYLPRHK